MFSDLKKIQNNPLRQFSILNILLQNKYRHSKGILRVSLPSLYPYVLSRFSKQKIKIAIYRLGVVQIIRDTQGRGGRGGGDSPKCQVNLFCFLNCCYINVFGIKTSSLREQIYGLMTLSF